MGIGSRVLPYGPFRGVLRLPRLSKRPNAVPWTLVLDGGGGGSGSVGSSGNATDASSAAAAPPLSPLAPAAPPSAMLEIHVHAACAELQRCVPLAPLIPRALSPGSSSGGAVVATPTYYVRHPQVVAFRRAAAAPLLAGAFKLDGGLLLAAMASIDAEWAAAVEAALGIGSVAPATVPKVTVLFT